MSARYYAIRAERRRMLPLQRELVAVDRAIAVARAYKRLFERLRDCMEIVGEEPLIHPAIGGAIGEFVVSVDRLARGQMGPFDTGGQVLVMWLDARFDRLLDKAADRQRRFNRGRYRK